MEAVIREKGEEIGPEGRLGHGNTNVNLLARGGGVSGLRGGFLFPELGGHALGNRERIRRQLVQLLEVDDFGGDKFVGPQNQCNGMVFDEGRQKLLRKGLPPPIPFDLSSKNLYRCEIIIDNCRRINV